MQIDCVRYRTGESLDEAVKSAFTKGQDILPVIDDNGILTGVIRLKIADSAVQPEISVKTDIRRYGGAFDKNYTGVLPDASKELVYRLLSGPTPKTSIVVHDNRKRFLGIIPADTATLQTW